MSDLIDHSANELQDALQKVLLAAVHLHETGRLEEAESAYRSVLEAVPNDAQTKYFLGVLLVQRQRLDEAVDLLRAAIVADSTVDAYWYTYIETLIVDNRVALAADALKLAREKGLAGPECDALAKRISLAQLAISNTAKSKADVSIKAQNKIAKLFKARQFREMEREAQKMCRTAPGNGFAWKALSVALTIQKRDNEARMPAQRAAELLPDDPDALRNLGLLLERDGAHAEAETWLRKGLDLDPHHLESLIRLGHILHTREAYEAAESTYRKALAIAPNDMRTHALIAESLRMLGRHAETEKHHLAALAIKDTLKVRSARLFHLLEAGTLTSDVIFEEHIRYGKLARAVVGTPNSTFENTREPTRRLRIGFVSADLHSHAVAHYLEPALVALSQRNHLDTYAYSNSKQKDQVTERLRAAFTHWRDIYDLDNETAARRIQDDRIDILFDLSSHTNGNRLELFARRVAPVQASWLGYPNTTGLDTIDYFITDIKMLPPGQFDDGFVEKIVRLNGNVAFEPPVNSQPINPLPALKNGYVTYGSFNRPHKLGRPVIAAWSEILRRVPAARMVIGAMSGDHIENRLLQWFDEEGIDKNRLSFLKRARMAEYQQQHHLVDLCLDAFPYTGATTALHSLWMGVPTVTFAGATPPSRVGAAVVGHVGLDSFAGDSLEDFIERAVRLSEDVPKLSEIRQNLRDRFRASPWGRPDLVASNFEHACEVMWSRWCEGTEPAPFNI